jgi:hypothetical protein
VRVAAADDYRIALPRQVQIVGVAAFAAQQSRIFVAWDRLADTVFGQGEPVEIDIAVHSGYLDRERPVVLQRPGAGSPTGAKPY